jgi:hypothetical protein
VGGAILVALLTVAGDRGFALAERLLVPAGVHRLFGAVEPIDTGPG